MILTSAKLRPPNSDASLVRVEAMKEWPRIAHGRLDSELEYIPPELYDEWMRRGIPQPGDIVMTTEAPLGEIAQLDDRKVALAQRLITLRGKPGLLDNTFLKFAMQSRLVQDQLRSRATGTTVLGIRQSELRKVLLPLPPLHEQHAIAHILGTLDNKIELNRRMNETLEAMARAIFKSWFVDFDPVRAKTAGANSFPSMPQPVFDALPTEFTDSPLGPIPKGWKVGCVADIGNNVRNGVKPEEADSSTPYIGLEHMPRRSISLRDWGYAGDVGSNKSAFQRGEILFGKLRPYFHKVGVAVLDGVCSTDIVVVVPQSPEWFGLLLGHLSSVEFINYVNAGSTGTRMPRTSWKYMGRYGIALPPVQLAEVFTEWANAEVELICADIMQSRTLAAIRDALLPKLLSAEIRVRQPEELPSKPQSLSSRQMPRNRAHTTNQGM